MRNFIVYFCLWLVFAPVVLAADWTKVKDLQPGQVIRTIDGWEKIKTIEFLPPEPVFDIQIANTHNFVGNGIVAHNTRVDLSTDPQSYVHFGFGGKNLLIVNLDKDPKLVSILDRAENEIRRQLPNSKKNTLELVMDWVNKNAVGRPEDVQSYFNSHDGQALLGEVFCEAAACRERSYVMHLILYRLGINSEVIVATDAKKIRHAAVHVNDMNLVLDTANTAGLKRPVTLETFKQRYHWDSSVIDRFSVIDELKLPIDAQTTEVINGLSREIKWRATAFDVVLMTTPVIGGIILMSLLSSPATTPTQMPTQSPTVIPTKTPVARVTEAVQSAISVLEKVVILSIPTLTTWQPPVEVESLNIIEKSTPAKPVIPPEAEGKPADISRTGKGDYKFYVVWDENKRNSFVNSIPLNSFASPGTAAHSEGAIFTGVLAIDNLSMYGAAVQSDGRILLFEADGNPHHQGTFFTLPSGMRVEKMNWGTGLKQNNLILTVSEKNGTKSLYEITNAAEHDLGKYPKGCTQAVHPLTDCMMWYNRLELPKTLIKLND